MTRLELFFTTYSRTPLSKWFFVLYLFFVLWTGCSMLELSKEFLIPYERCYRMIRTMMERISASVESKNSVMLKKKVESDEFYVKAGLKGRSYHEEILSLGRHPRKRALRAWWRGRGTFQKDQPMIVCLHQRKGSITEFYVPQTKRQPILGTLENHVKQGAMIYTDDYKPYKFLHRHGFKHKFVNHSQKEYARGDIHINNCECRTNLYKLWIRKFMGVNKKNLQTYSKTFQFIMQSRIDKIPREERFMKILSLP